MELSTCSKCQSTGTVEPATLSITPPDLKSLEIETYDDPTAMLLKGRHSSGVGATVCTSCGHIDLYATDPRNLTTKKTR